MSLNFENRVAIITGAGGGLGREYALGLARKGATVVVNDLGIGAENVAAEIIAAGGRAIAVKTSVTDFDAVQAMVEHTLQTFGRLDIIVNNAGILRDKTFAKMELSDFREVLDVHLMGAVHLCKATWPHFCEQHYGRIVMATSSSGLYGNFGQSNYSAAKLALVGLMQTLALEGAKYDIRVNSLAPTAATRMTENLFPAEILKTLQASDVVPALLYLASEQAPSRAILCAGAGHFASSHISLTQGVWLGRGDDVADELAHRFVEVTERAGDTVPQTGLAQGQQELTNAMKNLQNAKPVPN